MKKILVSAILGLAAIASVQAQNSIQLYSYGTPSAGNIVYGLNGGGTLGAAVTGGFTVGVYYVIGSSVAAVDTFTGGATTQAGSNRDTLVGSGLTLGTGLGSTAALGTDGPGIYDTTATFTVNPTSVASQTVTLVLVAYNGASYETSSIRGHSGAFTMTAVQAPGFALLTGNFAPVGGFAVTTAVPEPTTFALAGLGLAGLVIFRRRK